MKRNWLQNVAIVAALAVISTTALAENKSRIKFGPSSIGSLQSSGQSSNNLPRNLRIARTTGGLGVISGLNGVNSNPTLFKTQIKNFGVVGNANQGRNLNLGGLITNKNTQLLSQSSPLSNMLQNGKIKLINQSGQNNTAAGLVKSGKIDPGFNKCLPVKIGCLPWWWGCYHWCQPNYNICYPIVYTKPIMVPYAVPVVSEVAVGVEEKLMQVPAGATLTLQALNLGSSAGQVVLQFNQVALPAMVNEWKADAVTATLPPMGLSANLRAEIILVKADGNVAHTVKVEVIPSQPQSQSAGVTVTVAGK